MYRNCSILASSRGGWVKPASLKRRSTSEPRRQGTQRYLDGSGVLGRPEPTMRARQCTGRAVELAESCAARRLCIDQLDGESEVVVDEQMPRIGGGRGQTLWSITSARAWLNEAGSGSWPESARWAWPRR